MENKQKIKGFGLLTLALVLLFNPNVSVIDILPDFIAFFIIMHLLKDISDKVPYFAELRTSVKKLFIFSLLRIPAQFIISVAQSKNTSDIYMKALMTFTFSAVELLLLWCAVTDLFRALTYMGSRSDNTALITPFALTKTKKMTPDGLKLLSYLFVIIKCTLTTVPELFVIFYDTLMAPTNFQVKLIRSYPYAMIFGVAVTVAVGIFWLVASLKYAKAASAEGKFTDAIDYFMTPEKIEFVRKKVFLRKRVSALNFIILGAVLSFDLVFSDFRYINLLPHFLGIAAISYGFISLVKGSKKAIGFKIVSAVYTALSLAAYVTSVIFLSRYSYADFTSAWSNAKDTYLYVIITAVCELLAAVIFYISLGKNMKSYVLENTGIPPTSDRYSITDKYRHAALIKKGFTLAVIGILLNAAKCANVFLQGDLQYRAIKSQGNAVNLIFMTSLPWFGLVITALALIFVGYAFYYIGLLKEDARIKYEEEE